MTFLDRAIKDGYAYISGAENKKKSLISLPIIAVKTTGIIVLTK